jgi:DNA-binding transcriptional regulator YiaG
MRIRCSCGGRLRRAAVDHVELAPLFGIQGVLTGPVPGLQCDACSETTIEGVTFDRMLIAVARAVLAQQRLLTTEEARFLRKALLGLTQAALAKRMGISPITVADWERGERAISKEHDYELRGIALSSLVGRSGLHLDEDLARTLTAPRRAAPPRRAHRYVVRASTMPVA